MSDKKKDTKKDFKKNKACLLYTSDAADDMQCVDLGGRRIIKKKSKFFNECVEEMKATGSPTADAVRFCTGG